MNNRVLIVVGLLILLGALGLFLNFSKMQGESGKPDQESSQKTTTQIPTSSPAASSSANLNNTFSVNLEEQNSSSQSGMAVFSEEDGKVKVTLALTGAPTTAQPAHIHLGSCPTPGGIKYPLSNVVNGKSETTLNTTIKDLQSSLPLAINVHKSTSDLKTYVSCGDIR